MDDGGPMSRRRVLAMIGGATIGTAGCTGGSSPAPDEDDEYDIGMSSIAFAPKELQVPSGTTVVWKNTNTRTHTVTAYEDAIPDDATYFATGGFDSQSAAVDAYYNQLAGGLRTGETYAHTFTVPGSYRYFCIPHENAGMIGEITVTE